MTSGDSRVPVIGDVDRQSAELRAGALDVAAQPVTVAFTDLPSAGAVHPASNVAALKAGGFLPEDMVAAWLEAIESTQARNGFLAVITLWGAAGTHPGA